MSYGGELYKVFGRNFIFRGQSNDDYKLLPSALRGCLRKECRKSYKEESFEEFKRILNEKILEVSTEQDFLIENAKYDYLTYGHIVDNVASNSTDKVLSANQGQVLDKKINTLNQSINNKIDINIEFNHDEVLDYISHDKKASGNKISVVFVENVGSFEFRTLDVLEIKKIIGGVIHE